MKGIILAAGKGTRMYPMTLPVCKPLIPVYDKPLIYYPMAVLMQAGIRDILIIVPPDEMYAFVKLFGDGSELGLNISYRIQKVQRGIADAFLIGESFIGNDEVCLVLGDNIFYGDDLRENLAQAAENRGCATVFGYYVDDPRPFGVVEMDENGCALSIEEKPEKPKSRYAVPGLYFYDGDAAKLAHTLQPSARGELEITALNELYLRQGRLHVELMTRGMAWLDTGTPEGMLNAAQYVEAVQSRQGLYIACPEEIAWENGWIDTARLEEAAAAYGKSVYGQHLKKVAAGEIVNSPREY